MMANFPLCSCTMKPGWDLLSWALSWLEYMHSTGSIMPNQVRMSQLFIRELLQKQLDSCILEYALFFVVAFDFLGSV